MRNLRWFKVMRTSGHIENGKVRHYQVTLSAGFTMKESGRAEGKAERSNATRDSDAGARLDASSLGFSAYGVTADMGGANL